MKSLILSILILFLLIGCGNIQSVSYDSTQGGLSTKLEFPATLEQKKQLVTELGVVYVGMPKEDLEKVGFTKHLQKGYYRKGNQEWITFSNWVTEEPSDTITFYLVGGKVRGWEE